MNETFVKMDILNAETRETLEKQLQLLSERSIKASDADLANLAYTQAAKT